MNLFGLWLTGVGLGFLVAVPVGPIGLLCIHHTLRANRLSGYAAGLGAAAADGVYSLIAGWGLALVAEFLTRHQTALTLFGGVCLCGYGAHTFQTPPRLQRTPVRLAGLLGAFLSTFLLTLANPLNVALFAAVFAGVGVAARLDGLADHLALSLGVGLGALAWWLTVTSAVSLLRDRFTERRLRWVNRASGALIILAGLVVFARLTNVNGLR